MTKKDLKGCFIAKDNQISFWYFQIRVISNIRTFEYNCYKQKAIEIGNKIVNVGKELEEDERSYSFKNDVEKFVKENIILCNNQNIPVNVNWLNLVLNEIPSELKIVNINLRHFYEFFANLLADSNIYQKEIKNKIVVQYIIKIFDLIFQNKIEELFNKDINSDDALIKFINKPEFEIIKKIKEINQNNLLETEIAKNVKNTIKVFEQVKHDLPDIINKIDNLVEEKTEEYHKNYELERKRKLDYELSKSHKK